MHICVNNVGSTPSTSYHASVPSLQPTSSSSSLPVHTEEEAEVGNTEDRPVPVPYTLCHFPADIQRLLDKADPAMATDPMYRRKLRKALSEDIAKYTMYVNLNCIADCRCP